MGACTHPTQILVTLQAAVNLHVAESHTKQLPCENRLSKTLRVDHSRAERACLPNLLPQQKLHGGAPWRPELYSCPSIIPLVPNLMGRTTRL